MLSSVLPAPRHTYSRSMEDNINTNPWTNSDGAMVVAGNTRIPPYGQREGYVPRDVEDFGDGGAFPEIHIKQYPLDIGRPDRKKSNGGVVALRVDADGQVRYDAILRQGMRNDQIMHSRYEDMIPKDNLTQEDLAKPDEEVTNENIQETRQAMETAIMSRLTASRPRGMQGGEANAGPTYIRYTPGQQDQEYNSGAKSRMIKLYEIQEDPLEPPKYRHRKLPNRPPSPPVPVMHSPPRPVTQEDQKNWKIPPCVSSWKNSRGYTLALHQRLAADGRSLQNHSINDKFAKFTESLHMAERQARHEVEERAKMRLLLGKKKKQEMEKELVNIAKAVKQTFQSGAAQTGKNEKTERSNSAEDDTTQEKDRRDIQEYDREKEERTRQDREREKDRERRYRRGEDVDENTDGLTEEQIRGREERDKIRKERARERKREFRLEQSKVKSTRQRERDISEKIALGQFNVKTSGDSLYDNRLFNQDSGIGSGFEVDDTYNLYDKPLFNSTAKKIYRPKHMDLEVYGGEDEQNDVDKLLEQSSKFKPHKAFEGAEASRGQRNSGAPVEFVKAEIDADDVNYSKNLKPGLQANQKAIRKEDKNIPTNDRERENKDKERLKDEEKKKRDRHERDRDEDRDREREKYANRERHQDQSSRNERHRSRDNHRDRHRDKDRDHERDQRKRRGYSREEHGRRRTSSRTRSHSRERSRERRHHR